MFPSLDIRPLPSPRKSYQAEDPGDLAESSIICETDHPHHSETVLVVSGLSSTTVSVDFRSTIGAGWLVDSTSR